MKKSKYHIEIDAIVEAGVDENQQTFFAQKRVWVDCYMIQDALSQKSRPAHAFKKLWALGKRSGGKSYTQDLREAIWSLQNELYICEAKSE
jgi:hypothetical protein